ncbi:hypothetical protein B0H16DRAFT_1248397, partial [Mycena metata]
FLFICPISNLYQSENKVSWPPVVSYWSFDPAGSMRMTTEEAQSLGLPEPTMRARAIDWYWDSDVYSALQDFFQSKGFDPQTRDVARHLGLPL